MGSHGIKDRVAIIGMGCTRFGEHWDKGVDDLIIAAAAEAFKAAGVTKQDVDALVPVFTEPGAAHPDDRNTVLDAM